MKRAINTFKKVTFLLFFIYFGTSTFYAQTKDDLDIIRDYQNTGSARNINGKTLLVNFWVRTKNTKGLKLEEKQKIKNLYSKAETWLKKNLKPYNKTFELEQVDYGWDNDIVISQIPVSGKDYDPIAELLGIINWTEQGFINMLKEDYTFDNLIITVNADYNGKVFARNSVKNDEFNIEFLVVHKIHRGNSIFDNDASFLFPHEILHLFGAVDLYAVDETSSIEKKAQETAQKYCGNSIMLCDFYGEGTDNLYKYKLDEFTAYLLGINNNYKPYFLDLIGSEIINVNENYKK